MPTAKATVHIQAPPETVFDFVADAPRIPEYVSFVRDVFEVSDKPPRLGTIIRERAKPGPLLLTTTWRIDEFDRPRRQVWVGKQADMEMTLIKSAEPEAGGTRYSQVIEYRCLPGVRPLGWLLEHLVVNRKMNAEFVKITRGIKRIVESEAETAPLTPAPSNPTP